MAGEHKAATELKQVLQGMVHTVQELEKAVGQVGHGAVREFKDLKDQLKRALLHQAALSEQMGAGAAGALKGNTVATEAAALATKMESDLAKMRQLLKHLS